LVINPLSLLDKIQLVSQDKSNKHILKKQLLSDFINKAEIMKINRIGKPDFKTLWIQYHYKVLIQVVSLPLIKAQIKGGEIW